MVGHLAVFSSETILSSLPSMDWMSPACTCWPPLMLSYFFHILPTASITQSTNQTPQMHVVQISRCSYITYIWVAAKRDLHVMEIYKFSTFCKVNFDQQRGHIVHYIVIDLYCDRESDSQCVTIAVHRRHLDIYNINRNNYKNWNCVKQNKTNIRSIFAAKVNNNVVTNVTM